MPRSEYQEESQVKIITWARVQAFYSKAQVSGMDVLGAGKVGDRGQTDTR